jgi:hypothetical protein
MSYHAEAEIDGTTFGIPSVTLLLGISFVFLVGGKVIIASPTGGIWKSLPLGLHALCFPFKF